jgi:hypothetical protein
MYTRQLRTASRIVYTAAAILLVLDLCFPQILSDYSINVGLVLRSLLFAAILLIEYLKYKVRRSFK